MKKYKFPSSSSGDTLVEVLIAMALVALILAAGYVTTNTSLLSEREAQERGQALAIAQSQIEAYKACTQSYCNYPSPGVQLKTTLAGYISGSNVSHYLCFTIDPPTGSNSYQGSINPHTFNAGSNDCYFNDSGTYSSTSSAFYLYNIWIQPSSSTNPNWNQIEVNVNWTGLNNIHDSMQVQYRLQ